MEAPEENAAAPAVDAVTQMTNRFSAINTDDADGGPLKLDGNVYSCKHCSTRRRRRHHLQGLFLQEWEGLPLR
ncbi:hypothetical protein BDA96_01G132600 [Sorghum bicolor]|uniref:Uncharacterized protein n=1 Tax=Sorghum bicolor TaxID=4558 RepID=A0A921RXN5_SORBI|nr:hypothetical protein BDA96_01G132600 [Sorghum bicolor]